MDDVNALRIEASHKKILEMFSSNYVFSIPSYQRPYAWQAAQIKELITDLQEAMHPESSTNGFYFLGSVVLVKSHSSPEALIVDGQQRLTTLTILLSVMRDLTNDRDKKSNRDSYIKQAANEDEGIKETIRLKLRDKDQPFFKQHIQDTDSTNNLPDAEKLKGVKKIIVENAALIRSILLSISEVQRNKLLQFVLQKCYLVSVEVPTEVAARRIFTVLNARGMDLSATDILKPQLLDRVSPDDEIQVSKRWEDVEVALGGARFAELFTHIRMIYEREKPRESLESAFPKRVPVFLNEPEKFMGEVLEPYADAFTLLMNHDGLVERFDHNTAVLIKSLNRLDNKDWLPPVLFAIHQYSDGPRKDLKDFIFKIERLAYFLFVIRADVNVRMSRYADVLNDMEFNRFHMPSHCSLDITKTESEKLFNALYGDIYSLSRVAKPLLLRLEQASSDISAIYDLPVISVEHVCPQSIKVGSQWSSWYSELEDHQYWVHSLANLVLLNRRKNTSASNYDFDDKKTKYFTNGDSCPFIITNEVLSFETWKPEDLENRQHDLIKRLAVDWKLIDFFDDWWDSDE